MGKGDAWNKEAHKIGRFGIGPNEDEIENVEWLSGNFFIFFFYDTCVRYMTTGRAEREGGKKIDKRCKIPFVMVSYSIYRDQFRVLSVVSEFTVPREIGTLRKNVMCTHIRRRSSRTSRRRVRSRLDSLLGR